MNLAAVEKIAKAVLYEGYMLYPYRHSSVKNQQRWNFGVLCPESYARIQQGSESCASQTQCLVQGSVLPDVELRVRFLQLIQRSIGRLTAPLQQWPDDNRVGFEPVAGLALDGRLFQPWHEVEEREVLLRLSYGDSVGRTPSHQLFTFSPQRRLEPLRNAGGEVTGVIVRDRERLLLIVETSAERCHEDVFKFTVKISNGTALDHPEQKSRDEALKYSLISAHVVLGANNCEFVSLLDPPEGLKSLATECRNIGTWPVLVGEADRRDTMLSSPIILYDYPQIAPESAGDLFDGTEIDEILSLRIMTLTDEEKREMRESDERARQILERTENLPAEQLMKLHGIVRPVRPVSEEAK